MSPWEVGWGVGFLFQVFSSSSPTTFLLRHPPSSRFFISSFFSPATFLLPHPLQAGPPDIALPVSSPFLGRADQQSKNVALQRGLKFSLRSSRWRTILAGTEGRPSECRHILRSRPAASTETLMLVPEQRRL